MDAATGEKNGGVRITPSETHTTHALERHRHDERVGDGRRGARQSSAGDHHDGGRQRISLSVRAWQRDQERNEYAGHMDKGSDEPSMTGFGAQLAAAVEKKKK